jgi:hypothetical protein
VIAQLRASIGVNLKFHRRNRLLLGIGLLFLTLMALPVAVSLLIESTTQKVSLLRMLSSELNVLAMVFTAGVGLFVISSHLRAKTLKVVVTKPCLPETWLASAFLSAIVASALFFCGALALSSGLALAWGVPVKAGLAFVALESFLRSLILLAYLMFLATALHPVVAVLTQAFFNESTFEGLRFLLAAREETGSAPWLVAARWLCNTFYCILPAHTPYSAKTDAIHTSLRVAAHDWLYLLYACGYTLVVLTFFFLLSTAVLRRKPLT